MDTITKKDMIDRIAQLTNTKRVSVKRILQRFLDEIVLELSKGNRLEFRDFGVFESRVRAARVAQNPKTLERVTVPEKRTVKFKLGRRMKNRMGDDDDDGNGPAVPMSGAPGSAISKPHSLTSIPER